MNRTKRSMEMAQRAIEMIEKYHAGQKDKCGEDYVGHLYRVASAAQYNSCKHDAYIVGLLHDIVEDTVVNMIDIYENFDHRIAKAVEALTHKANEPYAEYMNRVERNHLATVVKMADLIDNMTPNRCVRIKSERDFKRTAEVLLPRYAKAYRRLARLTGEFIR